MTIADSIYSADEHHIWEIDPWERPRKREKQRRRLDLEPYQNLKIVTVDRPDNLAAAFRGKKNYFSEKKMKKALVVTSFSVSVVSWLFATFFDPIFAIPAIILVALPFAMLTSLGADEWDFLS